LNEEKYQLSRKNELMVKEMNVMTENRQELKVKLSEMAREVKEQLGKIETIEGEKEDMRRQWN
jgi:hypothetical protein